MVHCYFCSTRATDPRVNMKGGMLLLYFGATVSVEKGGWIVRTTSDLAAARLYPFERGLFSAIGEHFDLSNMWRVVAHEGNYYLVRTGELEIHYSVRRHSLTVMAVTTNDNQTFTVKTTTDYDWLPAGERAKIVQNDPVCGTFTNEPLEFKSSMPLVHFPLAAN